MLWKRFGNVFFCAIALASFLARAQGAPASPARADVRLRLGLPAQVKPRTLQAVVWLEPIEGTPALPFPPHGRYILLQKNRMFTPHLSVVQVGSVVSFPNADPFFHNVFSLFDGKRFDLGLYEAGSSKDVLFSREGISYIFCNIHPEMGAVVLTLSTPLYSVADKDGRFVLHDVPPGTYKVKVWIEGVPQPALDRLERRVHLPSGPVDLGEVRLPAPPQSVLDHANKFGRAYDQDQKPTY
jgi:hypothetical protein